MLRMPQNRFCIENRATDMCMNAYLAMACTTAATVEGLDLKTDPGPPLGKDLYLMSEEEFDEAGIQRLPRNLDMRPACWKAMNCSKAPWARKCTTHSSSISGMNGSAIRCRSHNGRSRNTCATSDRACSQCPAECCVT